MILLLLAMEPDNQVKGKMVPTVPRPLPGDIRVLLKKKSLPEADKKFKKKKKSRANFAGGPREYRVCGDTH